MEPAKPVDSGEGPRWILWGPRWSQQHLRCLGTRGQETLKLHDPVICGRHYRWQRPRPHTDVIYIQSFPFLWTYSCCHTRFSLFFSLSISPFLSLTVYYSLSLSISPFLSLYLSLSLTHSLFLFLTHSISLSPTLSLPRTPVIYNSNRLHEEWLPAPERGRGDQSEGHLIARAHLKGHVETALVS